DDADAPRVVIEFVKEPSGITARASLVGRSDLALPVGAERVAVAASHSTPRASRFSVLPPLVAVAMALVFRSALLALIVAVLTGGIVLATTRGGEPWWERSWALLEGQVVDSFRLSIVLFVLFLIGMIGVITRVGGIQGIVDKMMSGAEGARRTRIVTALMGLVIFFDDYSNSVVVGSSMRPLTDRFRISREKLAYLIDSTAAPIAGIALFSTWIGYEVSQYQVALEIVDPSRANSAYKIFLQTIPLRFYCILTIGFVLLNVFLSRDYGPMYEAERRAAKDGLPMRPGSKPLTSQRFARLSAREGVPHRARDALIPLVAVVVSMLVGIWFVGRGWPAFRESGWASFGGEALGAIFENNDYTMPATAVAAGLGSLVALLIAVPRIGLVDSLRSWCVGFSSLVLAIGILVCAWALAKACDELATGHYLVASVGSEIPLAMLPVLFFVLACLIAFATGTSWGTMGILIPIAIPLVYYTEGLKPGAPLEGTVTLLTFGAVLEGSIFGDHCSPISDTTVLSSVAAGSDHLDHVRTQIPYALTTMLIALLFGYLPVALGWYSWQVAIAVGLGVVYLVLRFLGRPIPVATMKGSNS
ncbi:MAG: hypothetical protein KDC38_15795, partial [Planctomycetes bacterium]|nr:hypothetical protein [Planctomycetota bacterium]